MSDGYAINVLPRYGIDLATVSVSRRGAISRWLTGRGFPVGPDHDDKAIDMIWRSVRELGDGVFAYCIKVEINASQEPGSNVTESP